MKKTLMIIFLSLLIISACTPMGPQERPIIPNDPVLPNEENNLNDTNQQLETDKSAIYKVGDIRNCKVTANVATVKSSAGNKFSTIGTLNKNDVVNVLDQVGNWYVILMDNNQIGAIDSNDATPVINEGEDTQSPQDQQAQIPQAPDKEEPQQNAEQTQNIPQPTKPQNNQKTPTKPIEGLSEQEQQMVNLVNQERSKNSLPNLVVDLELARVAEIKSQDMVDSNYFSHNSPNYGSPFDMMKSFGIEYLTAGENLAGNSSVDKAHNALMNSSGHRKNILHPDFTHIGIGVKTSPKYGYIYTQMFIRK